MDETEEEDSVMTTTNIDSLYLQVPDIGYWADVSPEIQARWVVERDFVQQLKDDPILQQIFERVQRKEPAYTDEMEMWDQSIIMTIGRMFSNRFDMDFELVRVAKENSNNCDGQEFDVIVQELRSLHAMAVMFEKEGGPFSLFKDRIMDELQAFVQWRHSRNV